MIDNTLWYGEPVNLTIQDPEIVAIRALNQKLSTDERVTLAMLPIAAGMTLLLKC